MIGVGACRILLRQRENAVAHNVREYLKAVIRPDHCQRINPIRRAEPEMETRIDGREKAAGRKLLQYLSLSVLSYLHSRADAGCIRVGAAELHHQVVIPVDLARVTSVD